MRLPSLGTHLRANRDLYKKFYFITLVEEKIIKKKSKIDFLFIAIINLLLPAKNNLVRKCAIHQKGKKKRRI